MQRNNFDFLRFYFAFIVVIGHLIVISDIDDLKIFAPYFNTYISVTAFFCISGFLITRSYLNSSSFKSYITKRASRLLPAYILVILFSAFAFSLLSTHSFVEYFTSSQFLKYLSSNLFFLNFIEPSLPGVFVHNGISNPVNGALWTLKVEVSFYLAIPIFMVFIEKVKKKYIYFIVIYCLSIAYKYIFEYYSTISGNGVYLMLGRQLPGFMAYFVSGMALNYYFDSFLKNKKSLVIIGLIILIIERQIGIEVFTAVGLSLIVFYVAFSFKGLNSFAKYGDISYGIYIFHCIIINTVIHFGFFERHNPFLVSLAIIIIVLITGFSSWHLIEKRFLKRTRIDKQMQFLPV